MKHILVPTDFSDAAKNAVDFAIQTSKIFPAKITILHSYEVVSNFSADYLGVNKEFTLNMLSDIEKKLDNLKAELEKDHNISVDTFLSTYPLADAIKKVASERKADMIVMGTLGASGIAEKIWGSRTSSVIGKTNIPVMVIPHDYRWEKPSKILFATNKFQKDSRILNYLFELAGLYMANVQASVFTDTDDEKAEVFLENKRNISEYESFLRQNYNEEALTSVHLTGTDFGETLQTYIEHNHIDMLVMVTYQTGFWKRLFNPSQTKKMSYNTKIPLLAIPATEE